MIAALPLLLLEWAKGALAWLARLPWQVWAVAALCVALWAFGHWRYSEGQAEVQARWDAREAAYALQRAEAAIEARNVEARHRAEYRAIADRFLKEQADADKEHAATVASLRAGAIRVRDRLACPARGPEAPAAAGGAGEAGAGGLLQQDAEFLLREAARADAVARQLNALIEAVKAGR